MIKVPSDLYAQKRVVGYCWMLMVVMHSFPHHRADRALRQPWPLSLGSLGSIMSHITKVSNFKYLL